MEKKLNNAQIRQFKAKAQTMEPTLKVGKNGLSPAFIQSLNEELTRHELVKVKFAEFKEQRKQLAPEMAEKTGSELVTLLGNVVVLYRKNEKPNTQE